MDENFLLKISIACSIIGLAVLFFISGRLSVDETSISKITMGQEEGQVTFKGNVASITEKENVVVIELSTSDKISVMIFKDDYPLQIGLKKGDKVMVTGKVQDYQGKKEIIADDVRFVG